MNGHIGTETRPRLLREAAVGNIHAQETCCGFGGTFSVKMAEISGEMVKEKVGHIMVVKGAVPGATGSDLIVKPAVKA